MTTTTTPTGHLGDDPVLNAGQHALHTYCGVPYDDTYETMFAAIRTGQQPHSDIARAAMGAVDDALTRIRRLHQPVVRDNGRVLACAHCSGNLPPGIYESWPCHTGMLVYARWEIQAHEDRRGA